MRSSGEEAKSLRSSSASDISLSEMTPKLRMHVSVDLFWTPLFLVFSVEQRVNERHVGEDQRSEFCVRSKRSFSKFVIPHESQKLFGAAIVSQRFIFLLSRIRKRRSKPMHGELTTFERVVATKCLVTIAVYQYLNWVAGKLLLVKPCKHLIDLVCCVRVFAGIFCHETLFTMGAQR